MLERKGQKRPGVVKWGQMSQEEAPGTDSVIEHLPGAHKVIDLIPTSLQKKNNNNNKIPSYLEPPSEGRDCLGSK